MDKSSFVKVFGESPIIKILDFLLLQGGLFDFSLTEIAENSGVAWSTLHEAWPKFEKLGIVKPTRVIGRAKMYMINQEHPLVQKLVKTRMEISDYFIEKELEKQKISVKLEA